MNHCLFIEYREGAVYPSRKSAFSPSIKYPEYGFTELSDEANDIYEMIRESFHKMAMDDSNYGTSEWNPFGEIIEPGNTVLIKPNLVSHKNETGGIDCLTTHPSIIRVVMDYVLIALHGSGRIILGDAPVQTCDFEQLMKTG